VLNSTTVSGLAGAMTRSLTFNQGHRHHRHGGNNDTDCGICRVLRKCRGKEHHGHPPNDNDGPPFGVARREPPSKAPLTEPELILRFLLGFIMGRHKRRLTLSTNTLKEREWFTTQLDCLIWWTEDIEPSNVSTMVDIDIHAFDHYEIETFTSGSKTRNVYRTGTGPAVIVIHEIPGITPLVAAFGEKVAERGMTAVLPDLFGTPGRQPSGGYIAQSLAQACVSREFTLLATNKTSPVTQWLRALAAVEHARCGGRGVGAVGMCLTGGFALAMMVDPVVVAPVLSQPSLPFPVSKKHRSAVGISDDDLAIVKERSGSDTCLIGLRFSGDATSPPERFGRLRRELGDGFLGIEIDSSEGNPWGYKKRAHSVLTEDYSDAAGSPTRAALDTVLDFFAQKTGVSTA